MRFAKSLIGRMVAQGRMSPRAPCQVTTMHWDYDAVRMIGVPETWWLPFTRSSSHPQRPKARTAFRGVTEGSRGVTPRR
jgi:hypothetical protein